ncbi:MAG: acyl-CoA dehydrogenase family protein [Thalassobaculaceae bacterium]
MTQYTEDSVREEARTWLKKNWNPNLDLFEWRNKLADSGWGLPNWPSDWYGRDLPAGLVPIVEEEFQRIGALPIPKSGIRMLAAATILNHGTEMHKEKFLRRIVTGEDVWCQLFSEPGSGSDLAGATTKAVMVGNKWVVNGQKVWTTSAHKAHWGLLLARTDMDATKHDGLSYFIIDMKQPGVETQPLKQMNGYASFNQVFLTDAEVLPDFQVAELGDGWKVATTTLMHERRAADSLRAWGQVPDTDGPIYDQERAEIETTMAPYKWYPQRAGRVDLIMQRAKETGAIKDPAVRQEIAKLMTLHKSAEWTARRARSAQEQGKPQGPEGSLGKLAASNVARAAAKVHTMISGADSMLSGDDSPENGTVAEVLISFPASSIAGGTDEIQKNIISERVLDMPKETRFDAGKPFKDIPRNTIS